jgi:hypothetical protein
MPLTFAAPYDLALTYALRRPKLAHSLAREAWRTAIVAERPDLTYRAAVLMAIVGGP